MDKKYLINQAKEVRVDALKMIQNAGSGNPGSALSCIEILVWLMLHEMKIDHNDPKSIDRDRLILSKGHAAPVFYSICSKIGWIDRSELLGFRKFDTRLQTHPDYNTLNCIDYTSGSLGQGLSAANGMALAARYLKQNNSRFFVLIGDGEMQEGQVWEAIMTAGSYKLGEIIVILDQNKFQQDNSVDLIKSLHPIDKKMEAFGWDVALCDGHSFNSMREAIKRSNNNKPLMIVADTIKGKGVSIMENNNKWHVGGPKFTEEILENAIKEIIND
tara:strand:- start:1865 stop:2683 length:819 start_codon:yes stop_codon:yes gene_type:complete